MFLLTYVIENTSICCYFNFQLDSADEQTAAIRRELDSRAQKIAEMERVSLSEGYLEPTF